MLRSGSLSMHVGSALRSASVVLVIVTADFVRSTGCLEQLRQTYDQIERRRQQDEQGQQSVRDLTLVPLFCCGPAPAAGSSILDMSAINDLLCQRYAMASEAERTQWLDDLTDLAQQPGIRQSSTERCEDTMSPCDCSCRETL